MTLQYRILKGYRAQLKSIFAKIDNLVKRSSFYYDCPDRQSRNEGLEKIQAEMDRLYKRADAVQEAIDEIEGSRRK